jgi:hypothetical protein
MPSPIDPTVDQVVDGVGSGITIALPFTVDISGLEAELFGTSMTLCGAVIPVTEALDRSKFYTADASAGWIHYVQNDMSEDSFVAYINSDHAADVITAFENAVRLSEGRSYDLTRKGIMNLDVSTAEASWSAPFDKFYSLEDFVLSYLANKIFGHPGALAPIKNDSTLRAAIANKFSAGLKVLYGASGCAISEDLIEHDASGVVTAASAVAAGLAGQTVVLAQGTATTGLTQNDLQAIVQQVMNLDPARFNEDNKGRLTALAILPGDKLNLQIRLRGNKYKLFSPTNVTNTSAMEETNPVAANSGMNGQTDLNVLSDDTYYVLQFTMSS